jgi:hypothetical protein
MKDYMKTGFDEYAEEFAKELNRRTQKTSNNKEFNQGHLEEYGEEIGQIHSINTNKKNPTRDEVGYSINDAYKMKSGNASDYSTETLESLE